MIKSNKKSDLPRGIVSALITPLKSSQIINEEALHNLIEFQIRNNISGFFILGTYGEGLSIHPIIRKSFAEKVAYYVRSKIPIINNVSATSIDVSIELAKHSTDLGIKHIALLPPLYYRTGLDELSKVFSIFDKLDLKVIVYNNPSKTAVDITPSIFKAISAHTDNIVGIKDSTASIERILELTEELSNEYYIAIASDLVILEAFLYNADSHICGICNAVPELSILLYTNILKGDIKEALRYKKLIWKLRHIAKELNVEGLSLIKAMLKIRGLDVGNPLLPNKTLNEKELSMVRDVLISALNAVGIELKII